MLHLAFDPTRSWHMDTRFTIALNVINKHEFYVAQIYVHSSLGQVLFNY